MDAAWSDHVGQALAECVRSGQHVIAVDLAQVEYISSAGIRVLIVYARQLESIKGRLSVINPSEAVSSVLELAGLETLLHPGAASVVELPASTMALGLGALGSEDASTSERLGELLAAGGAAVCQPADGTGKPDYLLAQAALTPRATLAYGLVAEGAFARLLRFDKGDEAPSLPLSVVVQACLDAGPGAAERGEAMKPLPQMARC